MAAAPTSPAGPGLGRADGALAGALFLLAAAFYVPLALRLAQGQYYEYYNLAFDFDASRVLSVLTQSPPDPFGFKHPLMLLLRPLGLGVMALGTSAKAAAGLVMAGTGAATVALVFLFLRAAFVGRAEAAALALLFAVTATPVVTAITTETYGFALLSLVAVWLVTQWRLRAPARPGAPPHMLPHALAVAAVAAGVAAAGVTITNAVQPAIAEALVALRTRPWRAAIRQVVLFGLASGLAFMVLAALLWHAELLQALRDPVGAAKTIWWMQTKGPTTGLTKVLQTFGAFSFVMPELTVVPLPETTRMVDFRDWSFPGAGEAVAWLWAAFALTGAVAGLAHPAYRPIALGIGAALVFNILFHLGFQFRGSVFIYAAHTHFLVFALACGLAPWVAGRRHGRVAYAGAVLALAALVASVNVPATLDFATRFDVPDTQCPAPCADGLP